MSESIDWDALRIEMHQGKAPPDPKALAQFIDLHLRKRSYMRTALEFAVKVGQAHCDALEEGEKTARRGKLKGVADMKAKLWGSAMADTANLRRMLRAMTADDEDKSV